MPVQLTVCPSDSRYAQPEQQLGGEAAVDDRDGHDNGGSRQDRLTTHRVRVPDGQGEGNRAAKPWRRQRG